MPVVRLQELNALAAEIFPGDSVNQAEIAVLIDEGDIKAAQLFMRRAIAVKKSTDVLTNEQAENLIRRLGFSEFEMGQISSGSIM